MSRRQIVKGELKPSIQPKSSGRLEDVREIKVEFGAVNEQVVLAAVIISPDQRARLTRLIAPDTFLVPEHSAAWQGLRDLTRRGLEYDPATLQGIAPNVDVNLLEQLSAARPEVPPNLDYHVTTLFWDRSRATALQGPVPALIEALRDPTSDADRVRAIARQVGATFEGANRKFLRDPAQLVREQTEEIRLRMQGRANFPFGIPGLDFFESIEAASDAGLNTESYKPGDAPPRRMTIGTAPKKVTLITGVSGSGKTSYVCNIVLGIARQRRRVLVGAWEVGSGMNLEMLAAISLGYSRSALLEGRLDEEMLDKIQKQMTAIGRWVSFFDLPFHKDRFDGGNGRPSNERNLDIVAGYVADSGCDVFVADLWKRCLVRTEPDDEEQALIRQQAIFEELVVHGIIVHQQRFKDIELRPDKKPTREGNKGSGAYVEIVDTMIGTHRPSMFKNVPDRCLEACVLKQRWGRAPLSVEHNWDGDRGLISGGRSIPYETVGDRSGGFDNDFFPTPRPMGNKKQRSR